MLSSDKKWQFYSLLLIFFFYRYRVLKIVVAIFRQILCALSRSRQLRSLWSHRISASIEASTLIPAWQDHYGKWRERVPPHFKSLFGGAAFECCVAATTDLERF